MQVGLSFKEIGVDPNKTFPLVGHSGLFKDGRYGAGRLASPTINALIRVDIELFTLIKSRLIGGRMNTIDGTNIYA
jgi:hypothetical protein